MQRRVVEFLYAPDFDGWSEAAARVGNCAKPIRLLGSSQRVDTATGEVLSSYTSASEPLGVTWLPCKNRRASECIPCSRVYAGDMFHLIRAGIIGGKTVPATVADNPLVFATLTAPSFGRVHGHRETIRACAPRRPGSGKLRLCRHGRPVSCQTRHDQDDPILGQPLCLDCYDHSTQVIWQWWAPDLWRRFTITLRRLVAKRLAVPVTRLDEVATVQYAKVAEYQRRGVVHFHALVRLDGPRTPEGYAPAPDSPDARTLDAGALAQLIELAAASVRLTVPGVDADDPTRVLAFGAQVDVRPVRVTRRTDDPGRDLSPGQVAGYLAKYATKSATDTTNTTGTGTGCGNRGNLHQQRIRATTRTLAIRAKAAAPAGPTTPVDPVDPDTAGPYELLGKWVHMLGFRGHFASKSRHYSITLGALRRARHRAQVLIAEANTNGRPLDLAALEADLLADDDDQTTLVIGHWTYAGNGWATDTQRVLAAAAAARAREYDQWVAEQRRSDQESEDRTR